MDCSSLGGEESYVNEITAGLFCPGHLKKQQQQKKLTLLFLTCNNWTHDVCLWILLCTLASSSSLHTVGTSIWLWETIYFKKRRPI